MPFKFNLPPGFENIKIHEGNIDNLEAESSDLSYKDPTKVTGATEGGEIELRRFGILVATGEAALKRFYDDSRKETKQLREVLGDKIWIRAERWG